MAKDILNWLSALWRGRLPLSLSVWVTGAVAIGMSWLLVFGVREAALSLFPHGATGLYAIAFLIVFYTIGLPIMVIWWVGAWRSASRHKDEKRAHTVLAKAFVLFFVAAHATNLFFFATPQISDEISHVFDDPFWGPRGIKVSEDGTEAEVFGHITRSVAKELKDVLATKSDIKVIRFSSIGGRVDAALTIKDLVRTHNMTTLVTEECDSACFIAFLGGERRLIAPTGRIGVHAASVGGVVVGNSREEWELIGREVTPHFMEKAFSIPPQSLWYPTLEELKDGGVVTEIISSKSN